MADKIQFFQYIQKSYKTVGIVSLPHQNTRFCSYNWRNSMVVFVTSVMFTASTSFLLFEANSFQEYSDSFWISTSFMVYIVGIPATISKVSDAFDLIKKVDEFVEKGEKKGIFSNVCISSYSIFQSFFSF